jgi:hypothetical protein
MKLKDLEDQWINKTHESIQNINDMLKSEEDYEQDFVRLVKFILETDINHWQFLPSGWEGSLGSAQDAEGLFHSIHHALVDDGDICWIDTTIHGPYLEFADRWDTDYIKKLVEKRFSHVLPVEYTVRQYSNDFIQTLIDHEEKHRLKWAEWDKLYENREV